MLRKISPVTWQGIDPGTFRLVAQRLNHYATTGQNTKILVYRNTLTAVGPLLSRFCKKGLFPEKLPAFVHIKYFSDNGHFQCARAIRLPVTVTHEQLFNAPWKTSACLLHVTTYEVWNSCKFLKLSFCLTENISEMYYKDLSFNWM